MNTIALHNIMPQTQLAAVMSEPMPCDNCKHNHCQQQAIACWDYAHWLDSGVIRKQRREPSKQIFKRAMYA